MMLLMMSFDGYLEVALAVGAGIGYYIYNARKDISKETDNGHI